MRKILLTGVAGGLLAALLIGGVKARRRPKLQVGDCNPGDESHSLMWEAVSSCRIFLSSAFFCGPAGRLAAWASRRDFSTASRFSNVWGTDR
jgi:hypothetical protein